jgi:hypothetical protein
MALFDDIISEIESQPAPAPVPPATPAPKGDETPPPAAEAKPSGKHIHDFGSEFEKRYPKKT